MTRRLRLSPVEQETLEQAVKHHPKAYARERAAGLLKVASQASAAWVAEHGLLTRHAPDTLYRWLNRYQAEGLAALTIRPGRGRKPRLSPPHPRRTRRPAPRPTGVAGQQPTRPWAGAESLDARGIGGDGAAVRGREPVGDLADPSRPPAALEARA